MKVNGRGGNLTPRHPKTPQTMVTKICVGDYVGDIYQHAKFHPNRFSVSVLCMRDFAPIDTKWLGYFLGGGSCERLLLRSTDFDVNTSNDSVPCKEVPFGGCETNI